MEQGITFGPLDFTITGVIKAHNSYPGASIGTWNGGEAYNGVTCFMPQFAIKFWDGEGTIGYKEGIVHVFLELIPNQDTIGPEDLQATFNQLLESLPNEGVNYTRHTPKMIISEEQAERIVNGEVDDLAGGAIVLEQMTSFFEQWLRYGFEVQVIDDRGQRLGNLLLKNNNLVYLTILEAYQLYISK